MANKKETPTKEAFAPAPYEPKFTFEQIVSGKRFKSCIDIVYAVLDHSKQYTISEVETQIEAFKSGKVG